MSSTPPFEVKDVEMDDKAVEEFICRNMKDEIRSKPYLPGEFLEIPSSSEVPPGIDWMKEGLFHGQESYSSFGEGGTTASVNAYGNILQISRYLGAGTSGIFCADPCIFEPWFIYDRMKELLDLSTDPEGGFGLCLNPELVSSKPRLQFLHNRWPRYTHSIGDLSVSTQYFANRGAIIQQYVFERTQENEAKKDPKKSDTHTSQSVDEDVNQTLHENSAVRSQDETDPAQESQVHDDRKQNQHPSGGARENRAQLKQAQGHLPQQIDTQHGETLENTQKKNAVKDCLRLKARLQTRESEWVEPSSDFNMDDPEGPTYRTTTGQNQYSLVVRHQQSCADEAIGLVIAVFVNGRATKIKKAQDENISETYEIDLDSEDVRKFDKSQGSKPDTSLEITVAYKLRLMAKNCSWESTLLPISLLDVSDLMKQYPSGRNVSFSTSAHLDFIMKRNLEHILSVCSIPVSATPIQDDENVKVNVPEKSMEKSQAKVEESERGDPIALTCGDISGHHVLVSASFFAFQFLLEIYSRLESQTHSELKERILQTLIGHMEWVFRHIGKDPNNSRQFCAGYWANGEEITRLREHRNPQHTSLQIINAKEFASKFKTSGKIPSWFLTTVDGFIEEWISSLRESDSRNYCVFPRVSDWGDEECYYLRDHVLIWKALGITEELEGLRWLGLHRFTGSYLKERKERKISLGVYTSNQARRRILKRFTTQNTEANERMLAIYRDTRDNSFMLDTTDTILFYDEQKLFHDDSRGTGYSEEHGGRKAVLHEWVRTLDFQIRQERIDEKYWQEPLQYALAMQIAKHGHQIDSRPASDIFDGALKVLLQSCSASGIFPGFLTREKLPVVFDEDLNIRWSGRDSYWHTSFELPYIIWKYAKERLEETSGPDKKQSPPGRSTTTNQKKTNKQTQSQMDQPIQDENSVPKLLRAQTVLGGQDFTDQKNVFEISDEWLVPCPEFLYFDPKIPFVSLGLPNSTEQRKISVAESQRLVIDIPKRRTKEDDQTLVEPQPCTNEALFKRLQQWRTKKAKMLIKKRIIWLSSSDKEAATICSANVPDSEQLALTGFFGKHNSLDKYFLDDPSASNNLWKTEFQLSFYQLEKEGNGAQSKPEIALAKRIRRGSMGFRFNGDFFDCYWTCHIINIGNRMHEKKGDQGIEVDESTQAAETILNNFLSRKIGSSDLAVSGSGIKKRAWQQRKVLELILFEEIIREITASTQEILEEIKRVLASKNPPGPKENETIKDLPDKVKETILFSKINGNAYFSFSAQWEVIQQLLQVLDEDLSDTVKKIESWQDRENSRGNETPRWTRKDEKRYRRALRRMQLSNAKSVRELLQLQEKVQSLRSSLISRRDYIRDDLNLRGAQNTLYFTYVTVVFLPLGFATGIFSMSETPGGTTLARMSGTAAVTFLLTIFALYYGVDLFKAFRRVKDTLKEPLGRVKTKVEQWVHVWVIQPLDRLFLPPYIAYVLWRVLGGSIRNFLNNQEFPSHRGPNDGDTGRGDSTFFLPEGNSQDPPVTKRRPASFPGDLENQTRPRHSFG